MTHIQIFYWTKKAVDDLKHDIFFYGKPKISYLDKYYVNVFNETTSVNNKDIHCLLEGLFARFNSEENPLSSEEKQKLIREHNTHTSMSLGDVVKVNDKYYVAAQIGFQNLE